MNAYIRILIIIICALVSANLNAQNSRTDTQDFDIEPFNIKYDYSITNEDYGIDCEGELTLSINIPNGTKQILIAWGITHKGGSWSSYKRHFYRYIKVIEFDERQSVIHYRHNINVNWGTYFIIWYNMEDGSRLCSDEYNVNSYISPSDLEMLQNYASIDSPEQDSYDITYNPDTKTLDVSNGAHLEIYDLSGSRIFDGFVSGSYSLTYLRGKLIIIRCIINNQIITKKIRI